MVYDARRAVDLDGVAYTVTRLGRRAGRVVLRCEPPLGAPIPDYARRLRLRARLPARALVVFTDAARGAEVWGWSAADGSHERIQWPGRAGAPPPVESTAAAGCEEIPGLLLAAIGRGGGAADPFASLRAALTDPGGPAAARAVWRSALALRVLDPDCGRGEWLLEAMRALERIHRDCLEQMEVWVGEAALGRGKRRPEHLRDLRGALARAGAVRETILLYNLHGLARDERDAAACRARLHRRLGKGAALPARAIRVRAGDPAHGFATRPELARALVGLPAAGDVLRDLGEEAEALSRAATQLCGARMRGMVEDDALAAGLRALERRRSALRHRLDALAFRAAGGDPRDAPGRRAWLADRLPLHPLLEWPGRFHLVRGGGV